MNGDGSNISSYSNGSSSSSSYGSGQAHFDDGKHGGSGLGDGPFSVGNQRGSGIGDGPIPRAVPIPTAIPRGSGLGDGPPAGNGMGGPTPMAVPMAGPIPMAVPRGSGMGDGPMASQPQAQPSRASGMGDGPFSVPSAKKIDDSYAREMNDEGYRQSLPPTPVTSQAVDEEVNFDNIQPPGGAPLAVWRGGDTSQ